MKISRIRMQSTLSWSGLWSTRSLSQNTEQDAGMCVSLLGSSPSQGFKHTLIHTYGKLRAARPPTGMFLECGRKPEETHGRRENVQNSQTDQTGHSGYSRKKHSHSYGGGGDGWTHTTEFIQKEKIQDNFLGGNECTRSSQTAMSTI